LKLPLDNKYDLWSLACSMYELITSIVMFDPFEESLIEKYDDIEDLNLMYLITSTIGLPNKEIINKSQLSDIFFTFDKKTIRFYNKLYFNPYINNILKLSNEQNKKNIFDLLIFITSCLKY
jgi:hypothetical protein